MGFSNVFDSSLIDYSKDFNSQDANYCKNFVINKFTESFKKNLNSTFIKIDDVEITFILELFEDKFQKLFVDDKFNQHICKYLLISREPYTTTIIEEILDYRTNQHIASELTDIYFQNSCMRSLQYIKNDMKHELELDTDLNKMIKIILADSRSI